MTEESELLNLLHAHGEQFMASFGVQSSQPNTTLEEAETSHSSDEGSEWGGIEHSAEEDKEGLSGDEDSDYNNDEFIQGSSNDPKVVVFSEQKRDAKIVNSKQFMSSKVSKLRTEDTQKSGKPSVTDDGDDERTNFENDALLHRLVHTKLLSGSLNSDLDLTHAQRQKAMSGRVLELSGGARLGRGEKLVRRDERNKASKRVREGLLKKEKERQKAQVEEAKNLGTYHPKLKRLFEDSLAENKPKKRQRGLQMGIGKFSGGTLKLSQEEISRVQGQPSSRGRGRGRPRGRR
ncbi:hypothetical protein V5O48_011197 [Marasmius crinis-equi]|uniref:Uncharacterized protein n=1 Tax=Marasmius crinis-equi TaxID=585013 RepID=A0ABR3F683_9AGAR